MRKPGALPLILKIAYCNTTIEFFLSAEISVDPLLHENGFEGGKAKGDTGRQRTGQTRHRDLSYQT